MILAMDGGGTKTQFLLSDVQGRIVAECRTEGCNYLQVGLERLAKIIREGTARLCQMARTHPQAIQLAVLGVPAYGESRNDSQKIESDDTPCAKRAAYYRQRCQAGLGRGALVPAWHCRSFGHGLYGLRCGL